MPLVSQRRLSPEIHDRLVDVLVKVLSSTNQTKSGLLFTHHFLSSTELTMLAKRVGIALLLKRGYSYDLVMDYLKVSRSTVAKVSELLHLSDIDTQKTLTKIIVNKQIGEVLSKFEYHLRKIIPPKGRDWSTWHKNLENDKHLSEEPI
jgi:uncharacterized protein YerC